MQAFSLAHVSDLHVSTYGDTFHDRARIVRRSAQPFEAEAQLAPGRYEPVWEAEGWRVLRDLAPRRPALVLVDPEGYRHPLPAPGRVDPLEHATARAQLLQRRRASVLARALPAADQVTALLQETPNNTNLRLLRAARALYRGGADLVLITGDLTDDGDGYELVEAVFRPWIERGRLLAVPGNHDLYLFPLNGSGRPRATHESKRAAWRAFATRIGLVVDETGAWLRAMPEADTVIVGLDSCARGQPRFYRHNGAIGAEQLASLRRLASGPEWRSARHRLVAFHHHVVPLPHGVGRRAPSEIGMRLDDARQVAAAIDELGATYVLHGHRHISEARQPAGCQFRLLAAPSLTLGCKSGDRPSYWHLELDQRAHAQRVYVPLNAGEGDKEEPEEARPGSNANGTAER